MAVGKKNEKMKSKALYKHVWAIAITPFTDDNRIDFKAIPKLMDWYINNGCDGVFGADTERALKQFQSEYFFLSTISIKGFSSALTGTSFFFSSFIVIPFKKSF